MELGLRQLAVIERGPDYANNTMAVLITPVFGVLGPQLGEALLSVVESGQRSKCISVVFGTGGSCVLLKGQS